MKTENTPSESSIAKGETLELTTRFGTCSRGKCWGKYYANQKRPTGDFEWCEKSGGTLYLPGPGYYVVGSSDGFNREAKASFYLPSKASESGLERVRQAEEDALPKADKITKLRELIATGEAKNEPEAMIRPREFLCGIKAGESVKRGELIGLRKKMLAELDAPAPVGKTREQEKAEEAMLG